MKARWVAVAQVGWTEEARAQDVLYARPYRRMCEVCEPTGVLVVVQKASKLDPR